MKSLLAKNKIRSKNLYSYSYEAEKCVGYNLALVLDAIHSLNTS